MSIISLKNVNKYYKTGDSSFHALKDINLDIEPDKMVVFVEGETDEKYYNKALDVFGYDKSKIQIEWIGRNVTKGKSENTGKKALDNAVLFCNIGSKKKFPQISHNVGTNFKLQVVKQSEDAEDEAVAVFQPKGPAPATK